MKESKIKIVLSVKLKFWMEARNFFFFRGVKEFFFLKTDIEYAYFSCLRKTYLKLFDRIRNRN